MIVVVAPHPSTENQKDGMIQRIAHIDSLMSSSQRLYLDISVRRFVRKQTIVEGLVTIQRLNILVHFFQIARLIRQANLIYIHSAYNALKACLFPTKAHFVFDAHGVVPEELTQEGQILASRVYTFSERTAMRRCNTLICVTRSMLEHFNIKYAHRADREEIVLPILPRMGEAVEVGQALRATRILKSVIYAGGLQVWQNVDKMLDAARTQPGMNYTFLTGDLQRFKNCVSNSGLVSATCQSVAPEAVKNFYLKHQYGFILRDDVLVNQVACPTKLMEYLYWGVVPIVVTPCIGDFDGELLHSVSLEDFLRGVLPDQETLSAMREHNQLTVSTILASAQTNQDLLKQLFRRFA
jgi:hypothetical protein